MKSKGSTVTFGLVLRAVCFSFLINLPYLGEFLRWGSDSVRNFEVDEYHYLPQALATAKGYLSLDGYYAERVTQPLISVLFDRPNSVIDFFVGSIGADLNLSAVELGLSLDLLIASISYIVFAKAFSYLSLSGWASELATIILLAFPQNFSLWRFLDLSTIAPAFAMPESRSFAMPVLRAVYTQVSYPVWGLSLMFFFKALTQNESRNLNLTISGTISALQIYIYIFAWLSGAGIFIGTILLSWLATVANPNPKRHLPHARMLYSFTAPFILASTPGILLILLKGSSEGLALAEVSKYYYLPICPIIAAVVLFILCIFEEKSSLLHICFALLGACAAGEILLLNIQPLLGTYLAPYSFQLFYLYPLSWALTGLVFVSFLLKSPRTSSLSLILLGVVASRLAYGELVMLREFNASGPEARELSELAKYLKQDSNPVAVVALNSFEPILDSQEELSRFPISPMPQFIFALTNRFVLHQEWTILKASQSLDSFQREMFLSWLLGGKYELILPCPEQPPALPGDLFTMTKTFFELSRYHRCQSASAELPKFTLCSSLKNFRVEYVLKTQKDQTLGLSQKYLSGIWQSRLGTFKLFGFDQQRALTDLCNDATL